MMNLKNGELTIPPNLPTTIETKYERLLRVKIPAAWRYMDTKGLPRVDQLGRFPRTRRAQA